MCISKSYSRGDTFRQWQMARKCFVCVCTNFNWQLRLHKSQMAIAFAKISNGNCVCEISDGNWQSIFRIAGESKYYFIGCNGRFGNAKFVQVRL